MNHQYLAVTMIASSALLIACSDDAPSGPSPSPAGSGGSSMITTGTGGATTGGGGQIGVGGQGGAGGDGGAPLSTCLAPTVYDSVFTLNDPNLCVRGVYDADVGIATFSPATWGRHGGPMVLTAPTMAPYEVTITRLVAPASSQGTLVVDATQGPVDLSAEVDDSDGAFFQGLAVDVPGTSYTMVGWAGGFPSTAGQVIALDGSSVGTSWNAASYFWGAATGSGTDGRFFHTGLSELGGASGAPGLFAADFCDGTPCTSPTVSIEAWGEASGPVAVDASGNAFAVQSSFDGTQALHGYAAAAVAPGEEGNIAGTPLWTGDGFGLSLGALAPANGEPGVAFYQPQSFDVEAMAVVNEPVVSVEYTVVDGTLTAGSASPALSLAAANTAVTFTRDDQGLLWLGLSEDLISTVFFVVGRRP